ncbi:hypothetical protein O6P43_026993 [Quillaja saponaria]|uniref:Uncharacterized protein n=1 Tax=Quillaja saponaria TaxID=32244 RepID=A0AAD7L557_QUISA|nr:hypothetical protein O6P43_026993 [Quillaja saponaria]
MSSSNHHEKKQASVVPRGGHVGSQSEQAARSGKLFAPKKPLAQTIVHSPSSLHRIAMEGFDLVDKCYGDTAEFGEQFAAKNYAGRMCTDPPFRPWI